MHAPWHRRVVGLTLLTSTLLLLNVSESLARSTNGVWRLIDPGATKPPARKHSTLIHDAANNRLVMFGGDKSGGGAHSDVWAFMLPCGPWVQLFDDNATDCSNSALRPCRRHGHAAVYIPGSPPRMLIHGGKQEDNCVANDTWQLTLGSTPAWTRLWAPTSPADGYPDPMERWHAAMVAFNGVARFYGGETLSGVCVGGSGGWAMCDMWSFNEAEGDWWYSSGDRTPEETQSFDSPCLPNSGTIPEIRYGHSLIVDTGADPVNSGDDRVVTFGGVYEGGIATPTEPSNAWSWPGWTLIGDAPSPDPAHPEGYSRGFHTATFDPIERRMIVIGGFRTQEGDPQDAASVVTSLSLAPATYGTWSTLNPTGTGPGKIAEHAAVYDPDDDRILVFGGINQGGSFRNDLWALDFSDDTTPPATTTDLHITTYTTSPSRSVTLNWTSGDDGTTGKACSYSVRKRLGAEITAANWDTSPIVSDFVTADYITVTGLSGNGYWYFALKAKDEVGNTSGVSNNDCIKFSPSPLVLCDPGKAVAQEENAGTPTFGLLQLGSQQAGLPLEVRFALSRSGPVTIEMFDVAGRRVARNDFGDLEPGEHNLSLATGPRLAAGLYIVRLQQGGSTSTRRVVLLQQ